MVAVIAPAEYEEKVLKSNMPVLLDLSAEQRCPPCRKLLPELDRLSETTKGKLQIYKIDADGFSTGDRATHPFLKLALEEKGIKSIPSMFLFAKGQCIGHHSGFLEKEEIRAWIESRGIDLSSVNIPPPSPAA